MNTAPEECRARALPTEDGFSGLNAMDIEGEGVDFNSLGFAGTSNTNSTRASTIVPNQTPIQDSNAEPSIPLLLPTGSRPPSPPISSPAPSRAPSPAPSPAASPAPSPAASRVPSLAISHSSLPGVTLSPSPTNSRSLAANPILTLSVPPSMAGKKRTSESVDEGSQSVVGKPCDPTPKRRCTGCSSMAAVALLSILDPVPAARVATRSTAVIETNPPDNLSSMSPMVAKVEPAVGSPKWFRTALSILQGDEHRLGQHWMELVAIWVNFEVKEGYKEQKKLSPRGCPPIVEEWIRRAQSPMWRPGIADLTTKFERSFNLWWTALQPEWHGSSVGETAVGQDVGGWENLRKPGLNGLLSLLAALFFWGLHVRDSNVDHICWSATVDDSLAAIKELIQHHHTS